MLAHTVAWQPDAAATAAAATTAAADGEAAPAAPVGTMVVQAYVRGKALDPNRLVYLPGSGAFQLARVDVATAAQGLAANAAQAGEKSIFREDSVFLSSPPISLFLRLCHAFVLAAQ